MADKGIPFDVPTRANLLQGQRLIDEQLREKSARDAKLSPLDKAYAALEAARTFGSGILATVGSLPTRAIKGEDAAQEYINQRMYIPTTEKGMDYVGNVGNFLEQLETKYKLPPILPEAVALQNVMGPAAKQATKQAAKAAKPVVGKALEDYMFKQGLALPVVKPTGGNWLTGDVEGALNKLKGPTQPRYTHINDQGMAVGEGHGRPMTADEIQQSNADPTFIANQALNKWIDSNLTNYVKKQMATPDDPVRKLAEEGILHMAPYGEQGVVSSRLMNKRLGLGQNPLGLGRSDAARFWERMSDISVDAYPASSYKYGALDESILANNPWLQKVPDETMINSGKGLTGDLGFDHILDVLREDLTAGRIRPEQLNKVSMEQAVRRTYEYDQEMAKRMAEAQIKVTEGMPIHKDYSDEGYKWIELAKPQNITELPTGYRAEPYKNKYSEGIKILDPKGEQVSVGETMDEALNNWSELRLEQALKYEGDTMGHCVGGYCPDVLEGRSRIFSLRDAKGEPHVTVEVEPNQNPYPVSGEDFARLPSSQKAQYGEYVRQWRRRNPDVEELTDEHIAQALKEAGVPPQPDSIVQIKGKQNRAPKEEYLPFVQDFVRSGQWSDVGDLRNTGLVKNNGKYMTQGEYDDYLLNQLQPPPVEGMKRGGSVHIADNPDTMMMEVEDQKFSTAGAVAKQVAKRTAKTAAQAVEKELTLPSKLPRAKPRSKEDLRPLAQEMAEATRGDFYRPEPSKSVNPAGKSFDQWKTEQNLVHDIRPTAKHQAIPRADIEKQKGMVKMGISGDTTVAEQVLHKAGPYALDIPSPQHGGALYGLGGEGAWASNNPIAANVQKRINEISQAHGNAPVLGQYMQMGKLGSDFALHFADANLRAIDLSKMSKDQIEMVNELIRKGSPKSGPRPSFPGIEDKESAYLHFAIDPEIRKHFNAIMQKPTYTESLGLPDGRIIHHAITEPELRNLPVTTTGFSQMELVPGYDPEKLLLSEHPTYSHVIPGNVGSPLTRTQYHTPAQVEFSDVHEYLTKSGPRKYDEKDMTRMYQTSTPRQIIDQQHIDEIRMFEELMKEYGGKKKGGAITKDKKFGIGGMAGKAIKSAVATKELEKQAVLRAEAASKSAAKQALMPQYNEAVKGMTKKQDPLSFEEWKAINYPEPEMAAGGAVFNTDPDMSDGGQIFQGPPFKHGGDVNLDAMYMAVNDAKFRRK